MRAELGVGLRHQQTPHQRPLGRLALLQILAAVESVRNHVDPREDEPTLERSRLNRKNDDDDLPGGKAGRDAAHEVHAGSARLAQAELLEGRSVGRLNLGRVPRGRLLDHVFFGQQTLPESVEDLARIAGHGLVESGLDRRLAARLALEDGRERIDYAYADGPSTPRLTDWSEVLLGGVEVVHQTLRLLVLSEELVGLVNRCLLGDAISLMRLDRLAQEATAQALEVNFSTPSARGADQFEITAAGQAA